MSDYELLGEDFDIVGYDDEEDEIEELLGAVMGEYYDEDDELGRRRSKRRGRRRSRGRSRRRRRPQFGRGRRLRSPNLQVARKPSLLPGDGGVQGTSIQTQPLGFNVVTFTNTSPTVLTAVAQPQRPVRPKRMFTNVTRTDGAAALVVTIAGIDVGANNALPSAQPLPVEMFLRDAVDSGIMFYSAEAGMNIVITYNISATPAAGDEVSIATSMVCDVIS